MTSSQLPLLKRLAKLRPGTTMCPGRLARECGTNLKSIRADLLSLARSGKIVLSQSGKKVDGEMLKGPFRVRLTP